MEIILQKDVEGLGSAFDVLNVKPGFALNHLLPKKLAVVATEGKKKRIEQDKKTYEKKEVGKVRSAEELAKKIEELSVTITVKVGEGDKLYGSVTSQMISEKLSVEGHSISKKDITISEPIRALGVYSVKVNLHGGVSSELKVWVVKEGNIEEAPTEEASTEEVKVVDEQEEQVAETAEVKAETEEV